MTDQYKVPIGSIGWMDLTVNNTEEVCEFYEAVVGWKTLPVQMNGYNDFTLLSPDNDVPYAGVCNAKGPNANLPPYWLIYINVKDVEESCRKVKELGGEVLFEPKVMGNYGKYSVIKDPAGAFCALFEPLER